MYVNLMKAAGVVLLLGDYVSLAAINRDDLVLWHFAEQQRIEDDNKLLELSQERGTNGL